MPQMPQLPAMLPSALHPLSLTYSPALGFDKTVKGYTPSPVGTDPFDPVAVSGGV